MDEQEFTLRQQLTGFIDGLIPLHAFRDWFYAQSWEASPPEDWPLIKLIIGVDSRLATFNSGDFSTDQLKQSMAHIVASVDEADDAADDPLKADAHLVHTVNVQPRSKRSS